MASILKGGGLALALIFLIIVSSSFETVTVANARFPYNRARHLATDCNSDSPIQSDIPGSGCGGGGSGGSSRPSSRRRGGQSGRTPPGSSRCLRNCCENSKDGDCRCCS